MDCSMQWLFKGLCCYKSSENCWSCGVRKVSAKFLVENIHLKLWALRVIIIIIDWGQVFQLRHVSDMIRLCNIRHRVTTANHSQTNGLTERFNKTPGDTLCMHVYVKQRNWNEILPFVTFAYNTVKQDVTGFTPIYLLHGPDAEKKRSTLFFPSCNDVENDYTYIFAVKIHKAILLRFFL